MPATRSFSPALFGFLRDLAANNERAWFVAHRDRYERDVRAPCIRFIADARPALRRLSPHVRADGS